MSITEEQVRHWVRDEIRRILDSGLIATETVNPQTQQRKEQPQQKQPHQFTPQELSFLPTLVHDYVKGVEEFEKGYHVRLQYVAKEKFTELADAMKAVHAEYVRNDKDPYWKIPKKA